METTTPPTNKWAFPLEILEQLAGTTPEELGYRGYLNGLYQAEFCLRRSLKEIEPLSAGEAEWLADKAIQAAEVCDRVAPETPRGEAAFAWLGAVFCVAAAAGREPDTFRRLRRLKRQLGWAEAVVTDAAVKAADAALAE